MNRDVLVTDTGLYVNHRLKCLDKYGNSLHVVKLTTEIASRNDIDVVDLSSFCNEYESARGTGYDSWQYQIIDDHKIDIAKMLLVGPHDNSWFTDVILLGDVNLDALYVLNALQKSDYDGNIHLIIPLPFERTVKGSVHNELLSDMSKVRSLAVYDPYKRSQEKYGNTDVRNVERVIDEMTDYLLERYNQLFFKMNYMSDSKKYFYDFNKDSFIDTDTLYVLDDYEITHTLGLPIDPYFSYKDQEENDYLIECINTPVPRPDGKRICNKLRAIRKAFAAENGIEYKFQECTYEGPCAGTCETCDKEARELSEMAKELSYVTYPKVDMED